MATEYVEGPRFSDLVKWEQDGRFSREAVNVLAGDGAERVLGFATVIGAIIQGTATATADPGNTGDGAVSAITLGPKAQVGDYVLTCIEAASNSGVFEVLAPDGDRLSDIVVGTAEAGDHLNLTISDGATDFAAGDKFTVAVVITAKKVKEIDFTATDGSQHAYGCMLARAVAPDGVDIPSVALVRQAAIAPSALVWPDGATEDQKAAALAQLEGKGIITRKEV